MIIRLAVLVEHRLVTDGLMLRYFEISVMKTEPAWVKPVEDVQIDTYLKDRQWPMNT